MRREVLGNCALEVAGDRYLLICRAPVRIDGVLAIGEEWSGMGARYERGELEHASGYEKMYGVTDEQLAFLSWHQGNLCRFAVQPIYDAALEADLERLALLG